MRVALPIALALLLAPAGTQAGEESCPALPQNSGFEWQYQRGIDFYLCRAASTSGEPQFFGIYVGFAANFHPQEGVLREKGVVGGYDVIWYRTRSKNPALKHARETLFKLAPTSDGPPPEIHVWIYAVTAEQLVGMMHALEHTRFNVAF